MTYEIIVDGRAYVVELRAGDKSGEWWSRISEAGAKGAKEERREVSFNAVFTGDDVLSLLLEGVSHEVKQDAIGRSRYLAVDGRRYEVGIRDPRSLRARRAVAGDEDGPRKLLASMPGKIVRVLAPEGSAVEAGQGVIVVEAMKMQNELKSPKSGVVKKVLAAEGAAVNAGDTLVIVE